MSNNRKSFAADGWADVFVRTLTILFVAFVTLNVKEYVETQEWDVLACAIDAGCIAAGTLLFYAILEVTSGGARRTEDRMTVPASR
jgi:hypothetical protein